MSAIIRTSSVFIMVGFLARAPRRSGYASAEFEFDHGMVRLPLTAETSPMRRGDGRGRAEFDEDLAVKHLG